MVERELEEYFDRLWPICRSITGDGLRQSLQILSEIVPMTIHEVATGTQVFDWTIPKEWNISDAYIITPDGRKICDFLETNLHVVNYSSPIDCELSYDELLKHLRYIKELPNAIPYVTSYYKEDWGFCLTYNEFLKLPKDGRYQVFIKSELTEGSLTYGEAILKGETDEEILFSTYVCHPSMANNELSGPLVQAFLYREIKSIQHRKYTYRFLFAPETIGVIAFLAKNGFHLKEKLVAGYVLTCCGDNGPFVYKRSKLYNSIADRVAEHVLRYQDHPYSVIPFSVGGSDERQYCSPGFNLPVGSLTRSMYQRYKEYHTSLDNKSFISFNAMVKTVNVYLQFAKALERNKKYLNTIPYCEPQLGKRGLYPHAVNPDDSRRHVHLMMHLLSYADGKTSLLEIADLKDAAIFEFDSHTESLLKDGILVNV